MFESIKCIYTEYSIFSKWIYVCICKFNNDQSVLKIALLYRHIMFLLIKLHILTIVYKVSIVRFTEVFVWSKKAAVSQCTNIAEFDPSIKWVNCAWNMKNHYSYIFCLIKYTIDNLSSQGYCYCCLSNFLSQIGIVFELLETKLW